MFIICLECILSWSKFSQFYSLVLQVSIPCNWHGDILSDLIEKNTWSGLEDFYSHLERALMEEGTQLPVTKKKTRRRRRLLSVGPTGSEEPKLRSSRPISSKSESLMLWNVNYRHFSRICYWLAVQHHPLYNLHCIILQLRYLKYR
jgi:hypothetical protein